MDVEVMPVMDSSLTIFASAILPLSWEAELSEFCSCSTLEGIFWLMDTLAGWRESKPAEVSG